MIVVLLWLVVLVYFNGFCGELLMMVVFVVVVVVVLFWGFYLRWVVAPMVVVVNVSSGS